MIWKKDEKIFLQIFFFIQLLFCKINADSEYVIKNGFKKEG